MNWIGSDGHRWTYYRSDGKTFDFRVYSGSWPDNQEWLAQGRLQENARHKKKMNALPYFPDTRTAKNHFNTL